MGARVIRHIVVGGLLPALCLGLLLVRSGRFRALAGGGAVEAMSSASVIIEQPSGNYLVLINRALHTDPETLAEWRDFFEGKEIGVIFEDISCAVPANDAAGQEMAESLQSRLPEHQMEIEPEDATLLLSKAEYGRIDVLLLSEELAGAYSAQTLMGDERYEVIHVGEEER